MINKELICDNVVYYVNIGKNSLENWDLINKSEKNDIWFHLDGYPSPHVVLKYSDNIPENIIVECCELCKSYSKYKNFPSKYIKVIYTKINNIKKGKEVGSVTYINKKENKYIVI